MKYIIGSWFEFQHHNAKEGAPWNHIFKELTEEQWDEKIKEMRDIGIRYLVLLAVALDGNTYYESKLLPKYKLGCDDPISILLNSADKYDIKVFISGGFFGDWTNVLHCITDPQIQKLRMKALNEVAEKYGHHKSFYGWYWPDEPFINKHYNENFISYVNECSKEGRKLLPNSRMLIAPYGTKVAVPDSKYISQLEKLDVDYIAYQDEVGVGKSSVADISSYYEKLRIAHDKAGRSKLWADIELFRFESTPYKSPLLPADFGRVKKQIEAVEPYVDNILAYQYQGMMNKPKCTDYSDYTDSDKLYADYVKWLGESRDFQL